MEVGETPQDTCNNRVSELTGGVLDGMSPGGDVDKLDNP